MSAGVCERISSSHARSHVSVNASRSSSGRKGTPYSRQPACLLHDGLARRRGSGARCHTGFSTDPGGQGLETPVTKNGRLPMPTALRRLLTKCALQAAVQVGIVHWPGLKAEFAAMTLGSDAAASPAAAALRPMRQLRLRSSCLFGERKALRGATLGQCYSG